MAIGPELASKLEDAAASLESLATENAMLRSELDAAKEETVDPESRRRIDAALDRIRAVVSPDASPSSPPSA